MNALSEKMFLRPRNKTRIPRSAEKAGRCSRVRWFETIEELRQALLAFQQTYNNYWLIERYGRRPPAAIREEQTVTNREAA